MTEASLKITERDGWAKVVPLDKPITKVGSGPLCDIHLASSGIAPLHLQIFVSNDLPTGCRVVNLANPVRLNLPTGGRAFSPFTTADLSDGQAIQLGEFSIEFHLPTTGGIVQASRSIEASLWFSDAVLRPDYPLEGMLTVKNLGSDKTCQFQVTLAGLPEDCYRIDPIPLIYPSAQEEVRVRLFHKTTYPPAGPAEILLTVTAPATYPGETLVIRQSVYVSPVFKQLLEISDDIVLPEKSAAAPPQASAPAPVPLSAPVPEPTAQSNEAESETAVPTEPAAPDPGLPTPPSFSSAAFETPAIPEEPLWSGPIGYDEPKLESALPDPITNPPDPDPIPLVLQPETEPVIVNDPDLLFPPPDLDNPPAPPAPVTDASAHPATPPRPAPQPKRDLSGLKVVRDQADGFWDNE